MNELFFVKGQVAGVTSYKDQNSVVKRRKYKIKILSFFHVLLSFYICFFFVFFLGGGGAVFQFYDSSFILFMNEVNVYFAHSLKILIKCLFDENAIILPGSFVKCFNI